MVKNAAITVRTEDYRKVGNSLLDGLARNAKEDAS